MKTSTQILFAVSGVSALLLLFIVAAFTTFNYLFDDEEYKNNYKAAQVEGREFGAKTDNNGCIKEGLLRGRKLERLDSKRGAILRGFVEQCLDNSISVNDFCKGVPSVWDVANEMDWRKEECRKTGEEVSIGCISVFDKKREYCIFDKK
jgi:hypothetical protein